MKMNPIQCNVYITGSLIFAIIKIQSPVKTAIFSLAGASAIGSLLSALPSQLMTVSVSIQTGVEPPALEKDSCASRDN